MHVLYYFVKFGHYNVLQLEWNLIFYIVQYNHIRKGVLK